MGFWSRPRGAVDRKLLASGRPARGRILHVDVTGRTVRTGGGVERVCVFTVEIRPEGTTAYAVSVRQRFPEVRLGEISPGHTVVAVRVDPVNPARVAIDWSARPPAPGAGPAPHGAAAGGQACEAVVVEAESSGMTDAAGTEIYTFLLTVAVPGHPAYPARVVMPVPPDAVPLLFPGSRLPATADPGEPGAVAVDWIAALAAFQ